ncbi:glycerol dehydratase reactivase beta/small subunit family protein [Alkalibacter saccharofermentans]|uniref:Dehydratase medium subunit n=1 Tax=Alkalibacter saccharofermentans DSM 14828 TaxID=1120975 RepID=A0A1M4SR43_9FIRM|nr:glycerol dehydratase reactivase beta/small subunit family protein [Alkalibacter saccharofermentans]SHE34733.1 Dehydratase medium subunit [Alkalibacter saccharofermentans DSM 14828]
MMGNKMCHNKTAIFVYISPEIHETPILNEVLWGIEEEEVPYNVETIDKKEATELGYQAAIASPLGVGVGFGEDGYIALHSSNLKQDEPLLKFSFKEETHKVRALGANAARLVKGIPFKEL